MLRILLCPFLFFHLWYAAEAQPYLPGNSYFGTNNYIEYIAGNLPIVIAVPHGGELEPPDIPDRNCSNCTYVKDAFTQELSREILAAFQQKKGCSPHVIINRLHRKKLDANREIVEAADSNATAELAWQEFHRFIETAKNHVVSNYQKGLFLDLHGHAHSIQRIELGYRLTAAELRLSDNTLNTPVYINSSGIKHLASNNLKQLSHAELLRGTNSLGALLDDKNYPAVPSDADPFPKVGEDYFNGGYNVDRHGSEHGGAIDGVQVECNQSFRFTLALRQQFAIDFTDVLIDFLGRHYFENFDDPDCLTATYEPNTELGTAYFPNPFCDLLTLRSSETETHVTMLNPLGQAVASFQALPGSPLNLRHLEDGVYYLVIEKEGRFEQIKKVIKSCQ